MPRHCDERPNLTDFLAGFRMRPLDTGIGQHFWAQHEITPKDAT
jgi:hypothetical protein